MREPETPVEVVEKIRELREEYPRWGKDKLVVLLKRQGINISASTAGRVINRLKQRGSFLSRSRLSRLMAALNGERTLKKNAKKKVFFCFSFLPAHQNSMVV